MATTGGRNAANQTVSNGVDAARDTLDAGREKVRGGVDAVREYGRESREGIVEAFSEGASKNDGLLKRLSAKAGTVFGYGEAATAPVRWAANTTKKAAIKGTKAATFVAAGAALLGGLAYVANGARNNARSATDSNLDKAVDDVTMGLPPVVTPEILSAQATSSNKMMGLDPAPGERAAAVLAARGGGNSINPIPPVTERNGYSVIDGKPVTDLKSGASPSL